MSITSEVKKDIFKANSLNKSEKNTGSVESQVALFTHRINEITQHLVENPKDNSSRLGLLKLVGKRRRLLDYVMKNDIIRYRALIASLKIRK
ncbi:MAG: 30S ribosomal protein S15 [Cytophagales bacterium]